MSYGRLLVGLLVLLGGSRVQAQPEGIPSLLTQLEHKKKSVRLDALRSLAKLGTAAKEAVDAVGKHLRGSDDAEEVTQAASTLAQIGPAAAPTLAKTLKDGRGLHARQAALALSRMGPAAKGTLPDLIAALSDPDPFLRATCARTIGEIGPPSEEATRALFQMVADPVLEVRQQAGLTLTRAGRQAVPGLKSILNESTPAHRLEVLHILSLMGPDAAGASSELLGALEDARPELRGGAARALGGLRGQAKEIIPPLMQLLAREKEFLVQEEVFHALTRIGEQNVPGFLEEMQRINREGNWAAPFALARFGPRGKDAVKPLIKTLKDPDAGMRAGAALALGQIGPDAFEAIPHLQFAFKDPQPQVRGAAAQALGKIDGRQEALAHKHFVFALDQGEKILGGLEGRLAKGRIDFAAGKARTVFADPRIQEPLRQFMDFHLYVNASTTGGVRPVKDPALRAQLQMLSKQTARMLNNAGPESIPALVYGINQAAQFKLGFC